MSRAYSGVCPGGGAKPTQPPPKYAFGWRCPFWYLFWQNCKNKDKCHRIILVQAFIKRNKNFSTSYPLTVHIKKFYKLRYISTENFSKIHKKNSFKKDLAFYFRFVENRVGLVIHEIKLMLIKFKLKTLNKYKAYLIFKS